MLIFVLVFFNLIFNKPLRKLAYIPDPSILNFDKSITSDTVCFLKLKSSLLIFSEVVIS